MVQSLQGVTRLTSQTCSFYAGVNAAGGMCPRAIGLSYGAGVEVRRDLKYGWGSSAAVLAPQGRYVHPS